TKKELVSASHVATIAIKPPDFHSVVPKLIHKKTGVRVEAGDELFFSKYSDRLRFVSPVSGTIKEIVRGDRRRVMEIIIEADKETVYKDFGQLDVDSADANQLKNRIYEAGCGAFIMQRPYDIVADPKDVPRDVYISAVDTAPLAADPEFIIADQKEEFQVGINALAKLTEGKVHLGVKKGSTAFKSISNVDFIEVSGKHPAGNVGVQIHKTKPINQGERIWTLSPENV